MVNIRELLPGDLFTMLQPADVLSAYDRGDYGTMSLHVRFTRLPKRMHGTESLVTRVRFVTTQPQEVA